MVNLVRDTLLVLGAGFLVANARLILEYLRFLRRRRSALLIWPQLAGLLAAMLLVFAAAYVTFQRQEIRA